MIIGFVNRLKQLFLPSKTMEKQKQHKTNKKYRHLEIILNSIFINSYIVKLNLLQCPKDPCMILEVISIKSVKLLTLCRNGPYLLLLLNFSMGETRLDLCLCSCLVLLHVYFLRRVYRNEGILIILF